MKKSGSDSAPDSGVRGRLQVAPSPWRTIDSAPKDRTPLLMKLKDSFPGRTMTIPGAGAFVGSTP